jgi:hypothetical protein
MERTMSPIAQRALTTFTALTAMAAGMNPLGGSALHREAPGPRRDTLIIGSLPWGTRPVISPGESGMKLDSGADTANPCSGDNILAASGSPGSVHESIAHTDLSAPDSDPLEIVRTRPLRSASVAPIPSGVGPEGSDRRDGLEVIAFWWGGAPASESELAESFDSGFPSSEMSFPREPMISSY